VTDRDPHDDDAERAVLGACLVSDAAVEDVATILEPGDFNGQRHQAIWTAILAERSDGHRVDPLSVHRRLEGVDVDLGYLHQLQNDTPSISNAARHANTVAAHRVRRDLIHRASDINRLAWEGGDIDAALDQARDWLNGIDMPAGIGAPDPDIDSFTGSVDTTYDWLIPDFLERRDRMLVTAGEGHGKSVLLTQLAVMAAAGVHPWTWEQVTPRNVLLVDLENGPRLVTRRLQRLRAQAGPRFDPQRLRIHTRPDGVDLTTPTDRRWLIDRCQANATELLVIGPAYRMYAGAAARGDTGGEDQARTVTKALDEVRVHCDVALLMETHAPHADKTGHRDLRPFGSTVWLRWPEFGIGLRRDPNDVNRFTVSHWRGARDERVWPVALTRGGSRWPWTPEMSTGTFRRSA
jgi:hypothetical protein